MQRRRTRRYQRPRRVRRAKPAYIKLIGLDSKVLDTFANTIVSALRKRNYKVSFVRLPTKKLWVHTRRSPCGEGSETYDHYELDIHRRLIVCEISPRDLAIIATLPVPNDVWVHLRMTT